MDSEEHTDIWNDFYSSMSKEIENIENKSIKKCQNKMCNNDQLVSSYGDIVCTMCGYVNESRTISDEAEWNTYSQDGIIDGSGIRCSNVMDPTNPYDTPGEFLPKYHWTWHLDSEGVKRYTNLSKIAIRSSYTSKQRAFDEAKYSFEHIQQILSLGEQVFSKAKLFWGIILKTDILKRGGNRRGLKACCIFYACLSEKQQRNREEISAAFDIDHSADFTKGEKIFREIFEKNKDFSWILFKSVENETMYTRYISQLGLPFKMNKLMFSVKEHTREHLLGIAAKSEVAGILYFVVKEVLGMKHPNKSEIAKCVGICNPTLNKVVEILKYFYSQNPKLFSEIK
jgi:hypothetical protein